MIRLNPGRVQGDDKRQCPSCGAALTITMAGACEACGVKVSAGARDWVLSKIEQDESYRG